MITKSIQKILDQHKVEAERIKSQMVELLKHDMCNAKVHYRTIEGKKGTSFPMILVHPQENGKRKVEYIGTNKKKQNEAELRISRYYWYKDLEKKHRFHIGKIIQVEEQLGYIYNSLTGKDKQQMLFS